MREIIEQKRKLKFDELNELLVSWQEEEENKDAKKGKDEFFDLLIDFFVDGYTLGLISLNKEGELPDPYKFLDIEYDGTTIGSKFEEYWQSGDYEAIRRLTESEANRMWTQGMLLSGGNYKTWHTMLDDKVRDTHYPLEGMKLRMNEVFATYDGDEALGPGMFSRAENNANCRCYLSVSEE